MAFTSKISSVIKGAIKNQIANSSLAQYVMSGLRSQYSINLRSNSERYTILVTSPTYFFGLLGRYKPL